MMSISHLLEDFAKSSASQPVALTDVSLEDLKLESFENGYQAGWEDAVKAQSEDCRRISTDLAQNLRDLSFTYHEAHAAILDSLAPVVGQMTAAVLPEMAHATLGLRIREELERILRDQPTPQVRITAAPDDALAIDPLLPDDAGISLSLEEDHSIARGQVHLRFGENEREIDIQSLLDEIREAVAGFFQEARKETA